jgi:hypothetical protein
MTQLYFVKNVTVQPKKHMNNIINTNVTNNTINQQYYSIVTILQYKVSKWVSEFFTQHNSLFFVLKCNFITEIH